VEGSGATTSAVVSFAEKLEGQSSQFYERLASSFPSHRELFLGLARDSRRNRMLVVRTYQETVTDALETGYSFRGLVLKDLSPQPWQEGLGLQAALREAIAFEEKAAGFYSDVAERSKTLLSTIHAAFKKVAEDRRGRLQKLRALAASQQG
jgi:rubrerythrin